MEIVESRSYKMETASVHLYGKLTDSVSPTEDVLHLALRLGAQRIYTLSPPISQDDAHWHRIVEITTEMGSAIQAEGAVLRKTGDCVAIPSRDCPIVVVEHPRRGSVGVAHSGRESLAQRKATRSVIHELLDLLGVQYDLSVGSVRAYVTGGICKEHFIQSPHSLEAFMCIHGNAIGEDLSLNLFTVIQNILKTRGVGCGRDIIKHDGLCTYEAQWLGSKRADKPGHNWTFVIRK